MGIECGSQVGLCDVPIRLDTYKGCTHGCKYCFVKRMTDIRDVKPLNCIEQLKSFINGKRTYLTKWCDWDIPLHWGGMSDPFQPCEQDHRISMKALEVFAETQYPFIVSTKGKLIADPEYIDVLKRCNAVVQVSMVAPRYDVLEPGCPTYSERLEILNVLHPNCKRLIVRVQPYTTDVLRELLKNIPAIADAGAYGIILEGFKSVKSVRGMVKIGGDYAYPYDVLSHHFELIRDKAHENGLKFYSGENRLRAMGDSLSCCGYEGVEGFIGNPYNRSHIENGDIRQPTDAMNAIGSAGAFAGMLQDSVSNNRIKKSSFAEMMQSPTVENALKTALCRTAEKPYRTKEEIVSFTEWLKSTGITAKEIDELTNTQMSSHWLCTKKSGQCQIPSPEHFDKIKMSDKIQDIPRYIQELVQGQTE